MGGLPRLIYWYVSDGARAEGIKVPWDVSRETANKYALSIHNEGMFQLWDELVKKGIFSEAITFIDSMRGQHGTRQVTAHSKVISVPHMEDTLRLIREDDIFVIRGGFKPWYNVLNTLSGKGHWVLFYRANTNRGPWPFWDVVLNDLISAPLLEGNRLHFNFLKPVSEALFYPTFSKEKKWDILLNASHIHPKKGQHRAIRAAVEYRNRYGHNLKICLPGGFIRSWAQADILGNIHKYGLDVKVTGGVPREVLNCYMNMSKIYMHVGPGGQNDRGALEAMRVGLPIIISNPKAFAPFLYSDTRYSTYIPMEDSDAFLAECIQHRLKNYTFSIHKEVSDYYNKNNGMRLAVARMTELFEHIFKIGKPDRIKLCKEYRLYK